MPRVLTNWPEEPVVRAGGAELAQAVICRLQGTPARSAQGRGIFACYQEIFL